MFDVRLINKFRDRVNSSDFVLFSYRNKKGKNQWNCICSAMDWITVAVDYINSFDKIRREIHSMEMFSYIASIDIAWEAIQQLHRVLYVTNEIPFKNECICFKDNRFNQSDNEYFKTIRACFGAHSVNLEDPTIPNAKRFASWSGGNFGNGDYSVFLYSNQLNENHILLSIYFKELDAFFKRRYEYLDTLINVIDIQDSEFRKKVSNIPIEKDNDPLRQLDILKEVSSERMDNEYYRCTIDELIVLFSTPVTCERNIDMANRYLAALETLIEEIYQNLSECNICDLDDDLLYQTSNILPNGHGYWLEKLSHYVYGAGYEPDYWLGHIEEIFKERFVLKYKSYEELFLLVRACIYDINIRNIPPTN